MASATSTTKSSLKLDASSIKEAGVKSLALGLSVAVTALAVQVAVVTGKSLVENAKTVASAVKG